MTEDEDRVPIIGHHRGVPLHDFQSAERIEAVVKPEIDRVFAMNGAKALVAFVVDPHNSPEARLFARARCAALWMLAAENREVRPELSLGLLDAHTAGLDSLKWISPTHYGTVLQHPGAPGSPEPPRRDMPLPEHVSR